jgi:inorganic pyrophosphatase
MRRVRPLSRRHARRIDSPGVNEAVDLAPSELFASPRDGSTMVVVETPKGTPNKLKFDPGLGAFRLAKVLPVGMVFPYDFGFLPRTHAPDGDPLDVLILMDAPLFPGCIVPCRLIGVLECEQRERDGKVERNDRLLAVAEASTVHAGTDTIRDLSSAILDGIEAFFADYNRLAGKEFRVLRRRGRRAAETAARRALDDAG